MTVNDNILTSVDGHVATVTINRPERRNALSLSMWTRMADLMSELAVARVRAMILTGAGEDFSAGADISEFATVRKDGATARAYEAENARCFRAIREAPFATIAAIRGNCIGGGFGLAASCDLRIATPDSRFAVPAARLGLAYPQDAMLDIISTAGAQTARYLIFTGERIGAERALEAGFLLECRDDDSLGARATEIAQTVARNAPLSVKANKLAIAASLTGEPRDIEKARIANEATFDSRDYAEGRAAFLEKRLPGFTGE